MAVQLGIIDLLDYFPTKLILYYKAHNQQYQVQDSWHMVEVTMDTREHV